MDQALILTLDKERIRFTPDGNISVIDAIQAVCDANNPQAIWENLKEEHPEILMHCEDYSFQGESHVPVIDSKGWEKLWILLPDYLSYPNVP